MVFQPFRSGWLSSTLTFLLCLTCLAQTEPRMIVTWDPIAWPVIGESVAKYRVQTTVGSLPYATAAECPASPCMVNGIEGTTTYKVKVAGVKSTGEEGTYSVPIDFLFASIQPLSPANLTASNATSTTPGKIAKKLSWTAVTGFRTRPLPAGTVVQYRVYQADTSPAVVIATSATNSFTVQGLAKHKSFQFYLTCVVDGIESYTSPAARVNT